MDSVSGREPLLIAGIGLLAVGAVLVLLAWLGPGPLTGVFRLGRMTIIVPIGLSLIASVVLTVLLNLLLRSR